MHLLTVPEASKLLRVATSTIYEYVRLGKIPAYKVNGKVLFKEAELTDFLEACKIPYKVKLKPNKKQPFKPTFTSTAEVLTKLNSL